ncbi:MAG: hypothetical protein EAX90_12040 [Candidatus Heimdallarchaeota archaeon]|nr:hypothetical protein [Candidatus Heimdallarchaeota archaeon]
MSVGIFVIMTSWLQVNSTRYTETSEILGNFGDLASTDIQIILEDDSAKYQTAYSYLCELYFLNNKYEAMIEYNQTNPLNYTQQDFDEVKIEFTLKMRAIISIVNSTSVFDYSVNQLQGSVANNYSYIGSDFYFITNQWVQWYDSYEKIHNDIRNFATLSFASSGESIQLPKIKFEKWTYHLYNNLSILEFVGPSKSTGYIEIYKENLGLSLVNLSLAQLSMYTDGYLALSEKINNVLQDLNNTLVTLALAGVLMGFAISFDKINFRRISMIVGLIILILAIIYFASSLGTLVSLADAESRIIRINEFIFI